MNVNRLNFDLSQKMKWVQVAWALQEKSEDVAKHRLMMMKPLGCSSDYCYLPKNRPKYSVDSDLEWDYFVDEIAHRSATETD